MDGEKKINMMEGLPLNNAGAANIFLTAGNNTKVNSPNGTVIHLNPDKSCSPDVGLHIKTTLSLASSKNVKVLFILNLVLSLLCLVISSTMAFYYWNEIISMRRQLEMLTVREANLNVEEAQPRIAPAEAQPLSRDPPVMDTKDISSTARKFFVKDLGEDMLLVDASKQNLDQQAVPVNEYNMPIFMVKDMPVIHFNGAEHEVHLGEKDVVAANIGPWRRDMELSTKGSEAKIEQNTQNGEFLVKEDGLYLMYAQIMYMSHLPNCYQIWANQSDQEPRLLSTCASGGDYRERPIHKTQISCSTQTVARLFKGDIVNLTQREKNKIVMLRPGYSYVGFVKLSS